MTLRIPTGRESGSKRGHDRSNIGYLGEEYKEFKKYEEFRSSGVQEFRSSGVQEFRSSGVQEFRVVAAQKLQVKLTSASCV
ncbi:MAG: hypothetical protein JOZ31_24035 [Verrucomicrobia bacterium]|nr:hypothetical protein [Verrucomicrobiota bacterium]